MKSCVRDFLIRKICSFIKLLDTILSKQEYCKETKKLLEQGGRNFPVNCSICQGFL